MPAGCVKKVAASYACASHMSGNAADLCTLSVDFPRRKPGDRLGSRELRRRMPQDPTSVELAVTRYHVGLDQGRPSRRAPTFERSQNVVVESVDDDGERDDVAALGTVRGKIKNGPDEIAVKPLRGLDIGR
jgi:hypothetical protein